MISIKVYLDSLKNTIKKIISVFFYKKKQNYNFSKFAEFIFEKLFITLLYLLPFLNITFTVHGNIRQYFPQLLKKIVPFGNIIFTSQKFIFLLFDSPIIFLAYYFGSDVILSPRYADLKISNNIKLALLITTNIELLHSLFLLYYDLFSFTGTIMGIDLKMSHSIAIFYLWSYIVWLLIYSYLYYASIRGKIPKVPNYPIFDGLRRVLDSLLFWIRVQNRYKKSG